MADEWFRSAAWDNAARTDFEARLARSRPHNRHQYLRIKGLSLRAAGQPAGARELLEHAADYHEPDGYPNQPVFEWETLADMAAERGDRTTAEELYRRVLALQNASSSSGTVEISLADLLLGTGEQQDRDEALDLLNKWLQRDGLKFDHLLFRWHLVLIRIAESTGDRETVQRAANTALTLAQRGPQLPRHPDVGLVHADKATLKRLRRLARWPTQ